jgi:hypothetical protein
MMEESRVPEDKQKIVLNCVSYLHASYDYKTYKSRMIKIDEKWSKDDDLIKFKEYFFRTWVNGRCNKWQVFCSPRGYTKANSTIESFNAQIESFTERRIVDLAES